MSTLRGIWRLWRVLWHLLWGVCLVYWRAPHWSQTQLQQTVMQWSDALLRHCGLRKQVIGAPAAQTGVLLVANHISFLDITMLHACCYCRFVSKFEVSQWPLIGRCAAAAGTLFLERKSRRAAYHMQQLMAQHLQQGETLAVFPEGTTSDGLHLLPFHGNLLQSAIAAQAPVQPVALQFLDANGQPSTAPCYIDDDSLLHTLWRTVCSQGLVVRVQFGELQYSQARSRQVWADDVRNTIAAMRRT